MLTMTRVSSGEVKDWGEDPHLRSRCLSSRLIPIRAWAVFENDRPSG